MKTEKILLDIYNKLYAHFGPQDWWPGDTPFEIIVGAVLTQNTAWSNVEKAIANLKKSDCLDVFKLHEMSQDELARLIRPAGYFNIKAKRLKNVINYIIDNYQGNLLKMFKKDLYELRANLLNINGVGEETADSILLYAGEKTIFVIDSYTKRLLLCYNIVSQKIPYKNMQNIFMQNLSKDVKMFNEFHALIVMLGKTVCKTKPECDKCPLQNKQEWV